jgi:hypothetical protein
MAQPSALAQGDSNADVSVGSKAQMLISVADPVIRVLTPDGNRSVGLQDVLAYAHDGTLIDLCAMRVDQRSPVVTALAILSHLLRRYSPLPLVSGEDWLHALR